ncbi:unnamed protein product [Mytilus coruscus]|uniref:Uncharacterized protein n=1 Tax=Mytilus coruscus TaxID=42192 RepID=A0A6J8CQU7_MYTCO|nr:unnamed protein product [Mytilus coruscus]
MYAISLFSVVNICTKDTIFQEASNTFFKKADSTQNCTCELSIINQDHAVTVNIQNFCQEISSSPTQYGCRLILYFGDDPFWIANCVVDNTIIARLIDQGKVMTIRSWTVTGNLQQNEGYCFEIRNNKDYTTALAAGASVGGLVTIIVVIAVVCTYRRFRSLTVCENEDQSASNTTYETLHISSSANGCDNTSTCNDYSSLNVKDGKSMPINGESNVRQNILMASISIGQRDNIITMENQGNLAKTTENRCEYTNIVL